VDGKDIGDIESSVIKDRHEMSSDGIIFIAIVVSEGMLMRQPDIFSRGFLGNKEEKVLELIRKDIHERVNKMLMEKNSNNDDIIAGLKKGMKNFIFKLTRRNPLVVVEILEV
jgi:Predicted hydrolase of the metallo-beta-lactamase superfamily